MRKTTLICEKCGFEQTGANEYEIKQSGWNEVSICKKGAYSTYEPLKEYLFCPECSKNLGLIPNTRLTTEQETPLADRLVDCIMEIASEAIANG